MENEEVRFIHDYNSYLFSFFSFLDTYFILTESVASALYTRDLLYIAVLYITYIMCIGPPQVVIYLYSYTYGSAVLPLYVNSVDSRSERDEVEATTRSGEEVRVL